MYDYFTGFNILTFKQFNKNIIMTENEFGPKIICEIDGNKVIWRSGFNLYSSRIYFVIKDETLTDEWKKAFR